MSPDDTGIPPAPPPLPPGPVEEYVIPPECIPNLDALVVGGGKPPDNFFAEKQRRLLTEPLYSSWAGPRGEGFLVAANVGLYFAVKEPPLAPDVMLTVGVDVGTDLSDPENRSYFGWVFGHAPDVVIEFVSDHPDGEERRREARYARIAVPYYAVFDPNERLGGGPLRSFVRSHGKYQPQEGHWFSSVGLGLTLWEGSYEGHPGRWLRWCDAQGQVIPTGRERADRLEARLRELGLEP